MTDYLKLWVDGLLKRSSLTLKSKITVVGEGNHLGPRFEFAKVQVSVEPASNFEVVDAVPANEELRQFGYPDWAVFGLLDVLTVSERRRPWSRVTRTRTRCCGAWWKRWFNG